MEHVLFRAFSSSSFLSRSRSFFLFRGSLVTSENVVSVLRPVCSDPGRPSNLKRVLLDLMNKVFPTTRNPALLQQSVIMGDEALRFVSCGMF